MRERLPPCFPAGESLTIWPLWVDQLAEAQCA